MAAAFEVDVELDNESEKTLAKFPESTSLDEVIIPLTRKKQIVTVEVVKTSLLSERPDMKPKDYDLFGVLRDLRERMDDGKLISDYRKYVNGGYLELTHR